MPKTIMHIDLDAFYAAVEEREHPEFRGKPVVVGADPKQGRGRGVASTCNYAARKFGIHSAMPISNAYKACPQAVFVRPNIHLYYAVSNNIMQILHKYGDSFEQVSVDEAYLDVTTAVKDYKNSEELAKTIKKEIAEKEKLSCSVGVGSNKLIAKIASDFLKPGGLVIVEDGKEKGFIAPMPVRKLLGVGPKTEEHLKAFGITTIGQLAAADKEKLQQAFGKFGGYLHEASNGVGDEDVSEDYRNAKSINRNTTFEEDTKDESKIESAMGGLADDAHSGMVEEGFSCRTIGIRVRFSDFETFTRAETVESSTQDLNKIKEAAFKLLRPFYNDKRKIRQIGIRVSNFSNKRGQRTVADFG